MPTWCRFCHEEGHTKYQCTKSLASMICYNCHEMGHRASSCHHLTEKRNRKTPRLNDSKPEDNVMGFKSTTTTKEVQSKKENIDKGKQKDTSTKYHDVFHRLSDDESVPNVQLNNKVNEKNIEDQPRSSKSIQSSGQNNQENELWEDCFDERLVPGQTDATDDDTNINTASSSQGVSSLILDTIMNSPSITPRKTSITFKNVKKGNSSITKTSQPYNKDTRKITNIQKKNFSKNMINKNTSKLSQSVAQRLTLLPPKTNPNTNAD
ncbi:unnamed protein product [Cunninghamella echinulata]